MSKILSEIAFKLRFFTIQTLEKVPKIINFGKRAPLQKYFNIL